MSVDPDELVEMLQRELRAEGLLQPELDRPAQAMLTADYNRLRAAAISLYNEFGLTYRTEGKARSR